MRRLLSGAYRSAAYRSAALSSATIHAAWIALCLSAFDLHAQQGRPDAKAPSQNPQPVSIVLLESKARALTDETVLAAAKRAFGATAFEGVNRENNEILVQPPVALIKIAGSIVVLTVQDQPAAEKPEAVARAIPGRRARQAFARHRATVHCGIRPKPGLKRTEAQSLLARFAAEIVTDRTLAVSFSDSPTLFPAVVGTAQALRGRDPIAAMKAAIEPPAVTLDGKAVAEAVATARRTWPQFLTLLGAEEVRYPTVKVRRKEGDASERIWLTVDSADETGGVGRVDSDPANLETVKRGDVKRGDQVTFRFQDLEDWVCYLKDERRGGFTVQLYEAARQQALDAQRAKKDAGRAAAAVETRRLTAAIRRQRRVRVWV